MTEQTKASTPRSLAAIQPGDRFIVDRILFDRLRGLCARLGLDEGVGAAETIVAGGVAAGWFIAVVTTVVTSGVTVR